MKFVKHAAKPEDVAQFLADARDGKLKPWFKSAAAPAESLEKGVRVLVGSNFEELALSADKDVLVKFYAPWCGHCKTLAPVWEQLATKLAEKRPNGKGVVAKMDSTENQCREEGTGLSKLGCGVEWSWLQ